MCRDGIKDNVGTVVQKIKCHYCSRRNPPSKAYFLTSLLKRNIQLIHG